MTCMISEDLRFARTQFMIDLAAKNGGTVTPEQFLKATGGSQKLISNILWIVKRSGYATVEQVRSGRKIEYWVVTVTGKCPNVKGSLYVADKPAAKSGAKPKATKSSAKKTKTPEEIKAANLAKMKKVSAKLAKKKASTKKTIDFVEKELGSTGEIATSFSIDNDWDSTEGLDVRALVI